MAFKDIKSVINILYLILRFVIVLLVSKPFVSSQLTWTPIYVGNTSEY